MTRTPPSSTTLRISTMTPYPYQAVTRVLLQLFGGASSSIGRARNPPNYSISAHHSQPPTPATSRFREAGLSFLQTKRKARSSREQKTSRQVFMVHIAEIQLSDDEGLEHVQLDDYYIDDDNDFISDMPNQNTNSTMSLDSHALPEHTPDATDTVKKEDEDDIQRERRRLRNAKCAKRRQRPSQQQHHPGNLYDLSTTDLRNIIMYPKILTAVDYCNALVRLRK